MNLGKASFEVVLEKLDAFGVLGSLLCRRLLNCGELLLGHQKVFFQILVLLEQTQVLVAEFGNISSLRKNPFRLSKSTC